MASFWKNAGIMSIAELFLKTKALIMMPFITKYLGTMNYGIWSQVMVIVSVMSPLVFCGMDNSLARFLPGKPIEEQKQEFTGWILFGLFSGLFLLSLILISRDALSSLFFGSDGQYPLFVLLAGANVVTTAMLTAIRNWFRIQNQAWSLVNLTILQNLIQTLVLVLILVNQLGIYELILWSLITDVVIILGYVFYLFLQDVFKKPSIHWLKPYFRFGIVFLPAGYAVWALNSIDRIFLAQYHTLEDIGIYSICFTIGYTLIQVLVNPIWSLFPTQAAQLINTNNTNELNILFNQSIKLICWLIFPAVFGFILVGDLLLSVLTTQEFAKGYLVIPIILAGYLFMMLSSYFESLLILKNKPIFSTLFTCIACSANIGLNFMLIPKFSYMGAAIATTLSFALQLGLSSYFGLKVNLICLDTQSIRKIFLASIMMFIIVLLIKQSIGYEHTLLKLAVLPLIGGLIYLVLTQVLNIYKFIMIVEAVKRNFRYVPSP